MKQRSIGRDKAIALGKTEWWKRLPARSVFLLQLNTQELCMPFSEFHRVAEEALGRSVWTHEFANPDVLLLELNGEKDAPSMQEILDLIPAEKRIES